MKRFLTVVLALITLISIIVIDIATAELDSSLFSDQFIDLSGQWHFKVYRKYEKMFQYFDYGGCEVSWENLEDAKVPDFEKFSTWEIVSIPASDYSTGGLLQMFREGTDEDTRDTLTENELFPKWSEAWFSRTFDIPSGFLTEETVTLLLGVIDDLDIVYINGIPVAQSGFKTASGNKSSMDLTPELGGFVPDGDFRFEKSYWEVSREYEINSNLLKEGTNEISIRLYNNNSFGGFYDRTIALAATKTSLNYLKGLPFEKLDDFAIYEDFVKAQIAAIENKDATKYSESLSEDYHNNDFDKADQIAMMENLFASYDSIEISDEGGAYYIYNGKPVYLVDRTLVGEKDGEKTVISKAEDLILYFEQQTDTVLEYGNHSRCYSVKYISTLEEMNEKELIYSIYLPPSYYENMEKRYPVVYLLHGINSTGESFVNVDKIEDRMDDWIESGLIQEMIVVMPNSGKTSWYKDTTPEKDVNDSQGPWASHISVDILGQIDNNYRTLNTKEFRGLTGISMGGGGAFSIGLSNTDLYSSIASHMGAISAYKEYIDLVAPENMPSLSFYLDCGYDDQMVNPAWTEEAGKYLESLDANVEWELRDGAHNSAFYMTGMLKSMKMHSDNFTKNGLLETWK